MPAPSVPATVTRWSSYLDISGTSVEISWAQLFEELKHPKPYRGDREHPGWSPGLFEPNTRKDEHVRSLCALVLDCDGGASIEGAREVWGRFFGLIHTTRKHSEAIHRFRIILALSRYVTPAEHAKLWAWANARAVRACHRLDAATRNPSRFWYYPGTIEGGIFEAHELDGDPIDVDAVLAELQRHDEPPQPASRPRETSIVVRIRRASHYISKMDPAISGQGGHQQTWKVALVLTRGFDLSDDVAFDLMAREYNPRCQPPWSERELFHKVRGASKDGRVPAGYLLDDDGADWHGRVQFAADDDVEREAIQDEAPAEPKKARQSAADFIRSTIGQPVVRIPTGIPTLDRSTRGGLMVSKMCVLGGAPNAGKTTLLAQMALNFAKSGMPVAFVCKDEDREGVLYRIGQAHGLRLEDLENDVGDARAQLAEVLESLPKLIVRDQDEERLSFEAVVEELAAIAGNEPAVICADSLQTIRTDAAALTTDKRAKVEANTSALVETARRRRWLAVTTCELARGAYRSRDSREHINDMAAFKESGDIEYALTVGLVLRSVEEEQGLVDVTVPKNKRGKAVPFRLKLDHATATFSEVPMAETDRSPARDFNRLKEKILAAVRNSSEPLRTKSAVYRIVGGTKSITLDAINELIASNSMALVGDRFRVHAVS